MRGITLIFVFLIFLLGFSSSSNEISQNEACNFFISEDGSDEKNCGPSWDDRCKTIDVALRKMKQIDGDIPQNFTICISATSKNLQEASFECPSIPIERSVSFLSIDGESTLNCTNPNLFFSMNGNGNLTRFSINNFYFALDSQEGVAIYASRLHYFSIKECTFEVDKAKRSAEAAASVHISNTIQIDVSRNDFASGNDVEVLFNSTTKLPYLNLVFHSNEFSGSDNNGGLRITHSKSKIVNSFTSIYNNSFHDNSQYYNEISYEASTSVYNATILIYNNQLQDNQWIPGNVDKTPFKVSLKSSKWDTVDVRIFSNTVDSCTFGSGIGPFVVYSLGSGMVSSYINISRNIITNSLNDPASKQLWPHFFDDNEGFAGSGLLSKDTTIESTIITLAKNNFFNNTKYGFLDNLVQRSKTGLDITVNIRDNVFTQCNFHNYSATRWRSALPSIYMINNNTFEYNYWLPEVYSDNILQAKPMFLLTTPLIQDEFQLTYCIFTMNHFRNNKGTGATIILLGDLRKAQLVIGQNGFRYNELGTTPLSVYMDGRSHGAPDVLSFYKNNFTNNYPGAIQVRVGSRFFDAKVNLTRNNFYGNQGTTGAFYVDYMGFAPVTKNYFFIDGCNFDGNVASYSKWPWGGAISINLPLSTVSVSNTNLTYNQAFLGGAIGMSGAQLILNNANLMQNRAVNGSELAALNEVSLFIKNSHFNPNPGVFIDIPLDIPTENFVGTACPPGYVFLKLNGDFMNVQYKCEACPQGQYELGPGAIMQTRASCKSCTENAVCHADYIKPDPGFWCEDVGGGVIDCSANCPPGFCKPVPTSWNETCTSHRTGRMCGQCKSGMSASIWSTNCVPDEKCYPGLFAVLGVLCIILVLVCTFSELGESSAWKITISFIQLLSVILISTTLGVLEPITLLSLNFDGESSSGGICVFKGMTQVQKLLSQIVASFSVFFILLLLFSWSRVAKMMRRRRKSYYQFMGDLNINNDTAASVVNSVRFAKVEGSSKYTRGLVSLILFVYFNITIASFHLIDCVPVNREQVLFSAAEVVCYAGWQIPFFILIMTILIPFPLLLLLLRKTAMKAEADNLHAHAVLRVLEGPYSYNRKWWESVMMARVLVMIVLAFFIKNRLWQSFAFTAACLCFLVLNMVSRPFKKDYAHLLETTGLICLTVISLLEIPKGIFMDEPEKFNSVFNITWIEGLFTLIPVSFGSAILVVLGIKWVKRKMNQT
eukprot:TRINITY_DN4074_c0_g1_i1.p1 TRINITY_DN4074_c0_g1~~TRINITY_DN4074_c0_g1_i1.p1  ORF type:complete len:1223 (+),score=260.93 TRINITY_DN4074_c0_g1_i1:26-3694(+)